MNCYLDLVDYLEVDYDEQMPQMTKLSPVALAQVGERVPSPESKRTHEGRVRYLVSVIVKPNQTAGD